MRANYSTPRTGMPLTTTSFVLACSVCAELQRHEIWSTHFNCMFLSLTLTKLVGIILVIYTFMNDKQSLPIWEDGNLY